MDALTRNQQRGLDSSLYNKANELQEDISMKKFDLRAKQIHLSAVRAQVSCRRHSIYLAPSDEPETLRSKVGDVVTRTRHCLTGILVLASLASMQEENF